MVCGVAVFALCALVCIWDGPSGSRGMEEMFQYLLIAFLGLATFVVVLVLQLNKARKAIIIGVTLCPIVLYSSFILVNYIEKQYDEYIFWKQFEVVNPWGTKKREKLLARLQAGEHIDKTNEKGQTLLHYAADIGDLNLMKFAVENGADVNKKDEEGRPAAYYALRTTYYYEVRNNWTPLLDYLADNGANLAEVEIYDEPLIYFATQTAGAEALSMLINRGVSVNTADVSGKTPLFVVKTAEMAKILIDAGADVNYNSNHDVSPTPVFEFLEESLDVLRESSDILKLLIEAGADLEVRNSEHGDTPLLVAIRYGYHRAALILIDAGANINAKNNGNETPLLRAAHRHYSAAYSNAVEELEWLKTLIELGADKSATNKEGKTAYDIIFEKGFKEKEIEFLKP